MSSKKAAFSAFQLPLPLVRPQARRARSPGNTRSPCVLSKNRLLRTSKPQLREKASADSQRKSKKVMHKVKEEQKSDAHPKRRAKKLDAQRKKDASLSLLLFLRSRGRGVFIFSLLSEKELESRCRRTHCVQTRTKGHDLLCGQRPVRCPDSEDAAVGRGNAAAPAGVRA